METTSIIAVLAALILICVCSSKLSAWINMPSLLLFLGVGMLAGSEGIGNIDFDNATLANLIGTVAMAFILFSGGFDTKWQDVRKIFGYGGVLASFGVLATAGIAGFLAFAMLRFVFPGHSIPLSICLLLGSIISSTDAAAVFSILRGRGVSLKGDLKQLLEFESGSNDPMAAFLTLFMLNVVARETASGIITPLTGYLLIVPMFALKMTIGLSIGYTVARGAAWLFNRINLDYDGLYHVLGIAVCLLAYSLCELCFGNGFLGAYVAGLTMGNQTFVFHNGLGRFFDGIAWLMQVVLFTMLGLLSFPSQIWEVKWIGLGATLILMLIARPAAVFICMVGKRYTLRERLFVSWVGLRGGAPIMLATFPLMAGIDHNGLIFHIVFFIVLLSVLVQGMTLMPAARLLHLDLPYRALPRAPIQFEHTGTVKEISTEIEIGPQAEVIGKAIVELKLPEGALVLSIRRRDGFIVPRGGTRLQAGDVLQVMGDPHLLQQTSELLNLEAKPV